MVTRSLPLTCRRMQRLWAKRFKLRCFPMRKGARASTFLHELLIEKWSSVYLPPKQELARGFHIIKAAENWSHYLMFGITKQSSCRNSYDIGFKMRAPIIRSVPFAIPISSLKSTAKSSKADLISVQTTDVCEDIVITHLQCNKDTLHLPIIMLVATKGHVI